MLVSRLDGDDSMKCVKRIQKFFTSIESLEERATSMRVRDIRNKIKAEFDKYIGRGRNKRLEIDERQLVKGNYFQVCLSSTHLHTKSIAVTYCAYTVFSLGRTRKATATRRDTASVSGTIETQIKPKKRRSSPLTRVSVAKHNKSKTKLLMERRNQLNSFKVGNLYAACLSDNF